MLERSSEPWLQPVKGCVLQAVVDIVDVIVFLVSTIEVVD